MQYTCICAEGTHLRHISPCCAAICTLHGGQLVLLDHVVHVALSLLRGEDEEGGHEEGDEVDEACHVSLSQFLNPGCWH